MKKFYFFLFVLFLIPLFDPFFADAQVNILQSCAGDGIDEPFEYFSYSSLDHPFSIAVDCAGNIYISQQEISTILQIPATGTGACLMHYSGTYSTSDGSDWPGTGPGPWPAWIGGISSVIPCEDYCTGTGFAGDGGPAGAAGVRYNLPSGLVYDPIYDRLYIADPGNNRIRMIQTPVSGGTLSTFYNSSGSLSALNIYTPLGEDDTYGPVEPDYGINAASGCGQVTVGVNIAVDAAGNLYVPDRGHHCILEVDPTGVAHIIAGTYGSAGYVDGAALGTAKFYNPSEVAVDKDGNVYVADYSNNAIRKINMAAGTVSTLAGGAPAMAFADGTGASARFAHPIGVAVDDGYRVYVADFRNNRIRVIDQGPLGTAPANVCTVAGNGATCSSCPYVAAWGYPGFNPSSPLGDGGDASVGQLYLPSDVKVDKWGNLFIADMDHNRIRYVCHPQSACTAAPMPYVTITSMPDGGMAAWCMPISFTAKAAFAGCNPRYQWYVNGIAITGATLPTYSYMPASGDIVTCSITAEPYPFHGSNPPTYDLSCPSPMSAISNAITVTVASATPITGPSSVCVGSTITLADATSGTWTSTGTYASVDLTSGVVTGITNGTETVTFTTIHGCTLYYPVTVVGADPISGPSTLCDGSSVTLTDATSGGSWGVLPSSSSVVTIGATTGVVTPITGGPGGLATVFYTVTVGSCTSTVYFTINVLLEPNVCVTESCCDYAFGLSTTTSGSVSADVNVIHACGGCTLVVNGPAGPFSVPSTVTLATIQSIYPFPTYPLTTGLCILNVHNGGCTWPVARSSSCCGNANYPYNFIGYKHSNTNSSSGKSTRHLSLSPNPSTGLITLSGSVEDVTKSKEGTVEIFDMIGKVIYSDKITVENQEISKSIVIPDNIPNGLYLIKICVGDYKDVLKFTLEQ